MDWWLHFGNGLAIFSMFMSEMLPLRFFLVGANACAFVFYRSCSPPLKVPMMWSVLFFTGHSFMIIRLLLENRQVDMSDIEHEVYCNAFREYGFSPFQFKKIMKHASYMRVDKGDIICNKGKPKTKTMYVLGSMELQQDGRTVGGLINGFVGDLLPPEISKKKEKEQKKEKETEKRQETETEREREKENKRLQTRQRKRKLKMKKRKRINRNKPR